MYATDVTTDVDLELAALLEQACQHAEHRVAHGEAEVEYLVQVRCPHCFRFRQTLQCRVGVAAVFACGNARCGSMGCGETFRLVEHPDGYRVVAV